MKTFNVIPIFVIAFSVLIGLAGSALAGPPVPVIETFEIADDSTGGDCTDFGTWDSSTKTCVLTSDIECTFQNALAYPPCVTILDDGINLNCKGNSIFTTDDPADLIEGVLINSLLDVKVKRCQIDGFDHGIEAIDSARITLFNNAFTDITVYGIRLLNTDNSYIIGNEVSDDSDQVIRSSGTKNNYVIGNVLNPNGVANNGASDSGIELFVSTNDTLIANTSINGRIGFDIERCTRCDIINNYATGCPESGFDFTDSARTDVLANVSESNDDGDGGNLGDNGFSIDMDTSAVNFLHNIADDNGDLGFHDMSSGNKTGNTANTYEGNTCDGNATSASPTELCTGSNP